MGVLLILCLDIFKWDAAVFCLPVQVAVWKQVVAAFGVIILKGLTIWEIVRRDGQARRRRQRLPVHPHCTAKAGHCQGCTQREGFRVKHTHTCARQYKKGKEQRSNGHKMMMMMSREERGRKKTEDITI